MSPVLFWRLWPAGTAQPIPTLLKPLSSTAGWPHADLGWTLVRASSTRVSRNCLGSAVRLRLSLCRAPAEPLAAKTWGSWVSLLCRIFAHCLTLKTFDNTSYNNSVILFVVLCWRILRTMVNQPQKPWGADSFFFFKELFLVKVWHYLLILCVQFSAAHQNCSEINLRFCLDTEK